MKLSELILADLKKAMLSQDSVAVSVLRMLKSELTYAKIAQGDDLDDDAILQVIRREIKKRRDAASSFEKAGHPDRAVQENHEATILQAYLPAQAETADVEAFVKQYAATLPEISPKARGEVIKATMTHFGSRVDGATVSQIVSQVLS